MTTPKRKNSKAVNKKSAPKKRIVTAQEFDAKIDTVLEKVDEINNLLPQPVELNSMDKTAFMVNMLSRSEGATLKEMAEALGWKENSIRGAMSAYAKKTGGTINSEKTDGVRTYYLKTNA